MTDEFDYVIAGGGLVGCVMASRLSQAGHSVALIEAGPEDYSEQIMSPVAAPHLHSTPYEYNWTSTPQKGFGNRTVAQFAGKLLSGSSAVNYGLWTRGHSKDYDAWARVSGDPRWGFENMIKYFKKVEKHHDPGANPELYGFDGPVSTTAGTRTYPLREAIRQAMIESGLEYNPDANGGNPFGFGAFTENWKDAQRQPAGKVYDLSRVKVLTNSVTAKVNIDASKRATGVTLVDGRLIHGKEVIVSCGTCRTPQVLMLSGIGPAEQLFRHGVKQVAELPVGEGLNDHCSATL